MRKIIFGVVLTLLVLFAYNYYTKKLEDKSALNETTALIEKQLKNVSKLVVTEGHFTEVLNYKNSKEIFGDYLTADKKALVIVNAKVSVSYDLKKLNYSLDQDLQTIEIKTIPNPEISIAPDLEYYDVQSDFLNPFNAEDYNKINTLVKSMLKEKIDKSTLKTNAENRLISELSKFFILSNSMGWRLLYKGDSITKLSDLDELLLK